MWFQKDKKEKKEEVISEEEIERYERKLAAEITKCERAIKKLKQKVADLTPKSFFAKLKYDKMELELAQSELDDLENRLIELKTMTGKDFLLEAKSASSAQSSGLLNDLDSEDIEFLIESAKDSIPGGEYISTAANIVGGLLKHKK